MPVKAKITLFFTAIVFAILTVVCLSIYYIAFNNRERNFKTRLTNRAVTTARLLSQTDVFNQALLQKIEASTTVAMLNKSIQAYNDAGNIIYAYTDKPGDILSLNNDVLQGARENNTVYFIADKKDAVAYHFTENKHDVIIVAAAYDPEGWNNLQQLRFILWTCFFGGIIIAVAGGYFFSKSLLRPIRRIADEINEISAQNLAKRIKRGAPHDEWNYLSQTLNVLLNRLEESFDTQGRFIANASHELSTPLTSISSQLEVSLQKKRIAEDYRLVMQSILEDVHHLNKLTQALLQFAKASGTSRGLEISLVRIDEILLRMPGEMTKLNNSYLVKLSYGDVPAEEEKLLVFGSEGLLFSAIKNIVHNACKYSADHTAVIQLSIKGNQIHVLVADNGIGISHEAIPYIFQPFYRVEKSGSEAGFGLGLPLAVRIIKLHKGGIEVESEPGKGTRFTLTLPVATG